MNTNKSDKNLQSCSGWNCNHCGAFNKIATAKFCGKCGSVHDLTTKNQPVSKAESRKKNEKKKFHKVYKRILKIIKYWLFPSNDRFFKRVIASAFLLLIISVIAGYKMYTNVNTIHLGKVRFSDVAIDHPVYSVCKNLLGIEAIGFRKNLELAPYENISATEWNHVLNQASKHLNQKFAAAAYFSRNDPVSVDNINNKLRALKANSSEIVDTSRIQSFYMLEQILFN